MHRCRLWRRSDHSLLYNQNHTIKSVCSRVQAATSWQKTTQRSSPEERPPRSMTHSETHSCHQKRTTRTVFLPFVTRKKSSLPFTTHGAALLHTEKLRATVKLKGGQRFVVLKREGLCSFRFLISHPSAAAIAIHYFLCHRRRHHLRR